LSAHNRRRDVMRLIHKVRDFSETLLDPVIDEQKQTEADTINRGGVGRQVNYLVERDGYPATEAVVAERIEEDAEIARLVKAITEQGRTEALLIAVYVQKQAEADFVTAGELFEPMAYLIERLGKAATCKALGLD
jgi:hypothetical protein